MTPATGVIGMIVLADSASILATAYRAVGGKDRAGRAMGVKGSSEDFVLLDTTDWSPEQITEAEGIRQASQYFFGGGARLRENEYPSVEGQDASAQTDGEPVR